MQIALREWNLNTVLLEEIPEEISVHISYLTQAYAGVV